MTSDPRKDLPSAQFQDLPETLGPETAAAGNDEVEKYLGRILDAFPVEAPTVAQLEGSPNLPWVYAGHQQVTKFIRILRDQYRRH